MVRTTFCSPLMRIMVAVILTLALVHSALAADQEKVLYTFPGGSNIWPSGSLVLDASGNLFGTTYSGEVFELVPSSGTWTFNLLYDFGTGGEDNTWGLTLDAGGNLYGTAAQDGSSGNGVVFELTPSHSGQWTKKALRNFKSTNGGDAPYGSVIFDKAGNLYGTAIVGTKATGVVFRLTPTSRGQWKESTAHAFGSGDSAFGPNPGLVFDAVGNLYGTTHSGGPYKSGTVFELSPSGGKWTQSVLYSFTGGADGQTPFEGVIFDAVGNLYGTTSGGGAYGNGVVFKLSPGNHGKWTESVIDSFHCTPASLVSDAAGNIYGTTGERRDCTGSVFELKRLKSGQFQNLVLYNFNGGDGWEPYGLVLDSAGNIYGATQIGGAYDDGLIYELTP